MQIADMFDGHVQVRCEAVVGEQGVVDIQQKIELGGTHHGTVFLNVRARVLRSSRHGSPARRQGRVNVDFGLTYLHE